MTSAVIEEPEDHTHLTSDDRSRAVREKYPDLPEGETFVVKVKKEDGSFGLRIAGGKGKPFGGGFVYVKLLIKDTPAEKCHQLKERDIILKVSYISLKQFSSIGNHPSSLSVLSHRSTAESCWMSLTGKWPPSSQQLRQISWS